MCFQAYRLLFANKYMRQHTQFAIRYLESGEKPTSQELPPCINLQETWRYDLLNQPATIYETNVDILSPSYDAASTLGISTPLGSTIPVHKAATNAEDVASSSYHTSHKKSSGSTSNNN
uniref:DNA mismatch repair protein MSH3 n=1 Tax=Lygus hesperus TaxID=30085 RepID=A0A0A9WKT7_LYGHE